MEKVIKSYILSNAKVFYSNRIRARFVGASLAARHTTIAWRLANPNRLGQCLKLAEAIALASNSKAVMSYRDHRFVVYQFQLSEQYWQEYTRNDVKNLGVGLADRRRQVDIQFLESAPQIGIFGTTGSGKTELIKSAICALAQSYRPDELKFLISDWHNELSDFHNLAHLAMPIAGTNNVATDKVLAFAQEEHFRRLRGSIKDDYRLVVVIDEASEIATTDDRLFVLSELANSRKFKINLILGTQRPTYKKLPDVIDKVNNLFVGLLDNARTSANVTGHSGLDCHKLTGAGDFVHVLGSTHERFQVARVTQADIDRLPRAEIQEPELEPLFATPIEKGPGRPRGEVEVSLVADYLANYEMSVRQFIRERQISQAKYYLHKNFAEELREELAKYGLGICKLGETYD